MTPLFIALSIITAFVAGCIFTVKRNQIIREKYGCPFKQACLEYNAVETRAAVKRVLTLLIKADVSKEEIRKIVDSSI